MKNDKSGSNCAPYPPTGPTIYILPIQTENQPNPSNVNPFNVNPFNVNPSNVNPSNVNPSNVNSNMDYASQPVQNVSYTMTTPTVSNYTNVQPNDAYMSSPSSQPMSLDTVFLTPPGDPGGTTPKCPNPRPCPPCGRCPEPSFDCKKVPNYSSTSNVLPVPVLTDFSQFGM